MRVLIIEDEKIAADRLTRLIKDVDSSIEIVGQLDSVRISVKWLEENDPPDLAFLDIQLADGKSFEILNRVSVTFNIIFTTAYDQYALDAFKVNAIDYLLKPVVPLDLSKAIDKVKSKQTPVLNTEALLNFMQQGSKKYKERFVIKVGDHLKSILTKDCQIIYSQDKATWAMTKDQKTFLLDFSLDQLEELLEPKMFFRINRKHIINIDAIQDIIAFSNSRLKLKVVDYSSEDPVVARDRVPEFKYWLDR